MVDEQELHHGLPRLGHLGRARDDLHALLDRRGAARHQLRPPFQLAEADAADPHHRQARGDSRSAGRTRRRAWPPRSGWCPSRPTSSRPSIFDLHGRHAIPSSAASRRPAGSASRECAGGIRPGTSWRSRAPARPPRPPGRRSCSPRSGPSTIERMDPRSFSSPRPSSIFQSSRCSQPVPSRQGVHCPHDSCAKNRAVIQAARTMQVVSSMTIGVPVPKSEPARVRESKSIGMSISSPRSTGAGGAARDHALHRAPAGDPLAVFVDQLAKGDAHGQLEDARLHDVPAQAVELGAAVPLGADAFEPLPAPCFDDVGHAGQGLDVVHDRGTAEEPDHGRERRLEARPAALALERLDEPRLFPADVGARARRTS